jgi:broad-specificity NMP kinase
MKIENMKRSQLLKQVESDSKRIEKLLSDCKNLNNALCEERDLHKQTDNSHKKKIKSVQSNLDSRDAIIKQQDAVIDGLVKSKTEVCEEVVYLRGKVEELEQVKLKTEAFAAGCERGYINAIKAVAGEKTAADLD